MGINLGDIIVEADDIYGDGVNIAARLEALAQPGDVVVSNWRCRLAIGPASASSISACIGSRTSRARCGFTGRRRPTTTSRPARSAATAWSRASMWDRPSRCCHSVSRASPRTSNWATASPRTSSSRSRQGGSSRSCPAIPASPTRARASTRGRSASSLAPAMCWKARCVAPGPGSAAPCRWSTRKRPRTCSPRPTTLNWRKCSRRRTSSCAKWSPRCGRSC